MTTPGATPRSSGAGIQSLANRMLHHGFRRGPQDGVPAAPAAAEPQRRARVQSPAAPYRPGEAEPDRVPAGSAAPASPPAQPRPAAKTPPRPDRSPAPPAAVPQPPRISGRRTRRRAPLAVNTAALLILAAGVLALVASLRAAMDPLRPAPPAAIQLQELGVPVDTILSLARVADVAVAAVAFGIYLLLVSLIRDGRNWARAGVCVLVAAGLFFGFRDGSFPHVAAALGTALGTWLLFMPSSARYFATHGGRTA